MYVSEASITQLLLRLLTSLRQVLLGQCFDISLWDKVLLGHCFDVRLRGKYYSYVAQTYISEASINWTLLQLASLGQVLLIRRRSNVRLWGKYMWLRRPDVQLWGKYYSDVTPTYVSEASTTQTLLRIKSRRQVSLGRCSDVIPTYILYDTLRCCSDIHL